MRRPLTGLLLVALSGAAEAQEEDLDARLERVEGELSDLRAGYNNGFFSEGADGRGRLTLQGLMQFHGTLFEPDLDGCDSGFDLRRMRLEFGGVFDETYRFLVETKFTAHEVELEEAWVGADLVSAGPALPTSFPNTVLSTAIGVTGYASNHAAVKLHYLHTACAADVVINGDPRDSEAALMLQFQQIF